MLPIIGKSPMDDIEAARAMKTLMSDQVLGVMTSGTASPMLPLVQRKSPRRLSLVSSCAVVIGRAWTMKNRSRAQYRLAPKALGYRLRMRPGPVPYRHHGLVVDPLLEHRAGPVGGHDVRVDPAAGHRLAESPRRVDHDAVPAAGDRVGGEHDPGAVAGYQFLDDHGQRDPGMIDPVCGCGSRWPGRSTVTPSIGGPLPPPRRRRQC